MSQKITGDNLNDIDQENLFDGIIDEKIQCSILHNNEYFNTTMDNIS